MAKSTITPSSISTAKAMLWRHRCHCLFAL
jgi:hypothetical protein